VGGGRAGGGAVAAEAAEESLSLKASAWPKGRRGM
jgi:hypothetical protein